MRAVAFLLFFRMCSSEDSVHIAVLRSRMPSSWLAASLMVRTATTSLSLLAASTSMMSSTSADWSQELKHALGVLGQHFLKGLWHWVAPEEVVVKSSVRVNPGRRVESEKAVKEVDRPLVLHVRLQPLLHPPLLD